MIQAGLNTYEQQLERDRQGVIQAGFNTYEQQLERDRQGVCPLYRPKGYKESERRIKKAVRKVSWWRPHDAVLFCPSSPGSELACMLKQVAREEAVHSGISIKVVERCGVSLQSQLPRLKTPPQCRSRHGRWWQTIYRSAMFCFLYKTPTPTPLVNCNENIEQNIICYQIYDTVIGLNKILGLLLVRSRFGAPVRQQYFNFLPATCFIKGHT